MKHIINIMLLIVALIMTTNFSVAGPPPVKVKLPFTPPVYAPLPPAIPPPASEPVKVIQPSLYIFGSATAYMTDYNVNLNQTGFSTFNFNNAFKWSTKEVIPEFTLGINVPDFLIASYSWGLPLERSGVGIPTVPIALGGYTFGPRPADTIKLSSTLNGKSFFAATPYFTNNMVMPSVLCEWWNLSAAINGTPNTTTTSQAAVDVKQDFHTITFGGGVSGEIDQKPLFVGYKAIYVSSGYTNGFLAQGNAGLKYKNFTALAGWKYNTRKITFGNGDLSFETNGPFATLSVRF